MKKANKMFRQFLIGFLILAPLFGIIEVIKYLTSIFEPIIGFFMPNEINIFGFDFYAFIIFMLGLFFCWLIGWFLTAHYGKKISDFFDKILIKIPLVKSVYKTIKRLVKPEENEPKVFNEAVLISLCEKGDELGFITTEEHSISGYDKYNNPRIAVYIPGVPIPANGRLVFVEEEYIKKLNITKEEALHIIFTLGNNELFND